MRSVYMFVALSGAFTLSACGGDTGPQTIGSVAPPAGGSSTTPTPTSSHSFVAPTDPKTYDAIGAVQHYGYHTDSNKVGQDGQFYAGDAATPRDGGISITYNPRDAIFDLTISRPKGGVEGVDVRFQDPMHRTAFGGPLQPQVSVPNFDPSRQIQYLQSGSLVGSPLNPNSPYYEMRDAQNRLVTTAAGSQYPVMSDQSSITTQTLFYQKFGTNTKYVSYAGFVRNSVSGQLIQPTDSSQSAFLRQTYSLDRAAFAFGERTPNSAVPTSGSGVFNGDMIATMVVNVDPTSRLDATGSSYLQWIEGAAKTTVDFANLRVAQELTGKVISGGTRDAYTDGAFPVGVGTLFSASGQAMIDMVGRGGFTGQFDSACFASTCNGAKSLVIAGSSVDGTFYGPAAEELGGGFRIVGGTPDQRIDILGAFVGKK